MWLVILSVVLVVVAVATWLLARRRFSRRSRPGFAQLSREDQVQAMRNREGGAAHRGAKGAAKSYGSGHLGERYGGGSGSG